MSTLNRKQDAPDFQLKDSPGKFEVLPTKPICSQGNLDLVHFPRVTSARKRFRVGSGNFYQYPVKRNGLTNSRNPRLVSVVGGTNVETVELVIKSKVLRLKGLTTNNVSNSGRNAGNINRYLDEKFVINIKSLQNNSLLSALKDQPIGTLAFLNLKSGSMDRSLLQELGDETVISKALRRLNKPVHILQKDSSVREIVRCLATAGANIQSQV